uniref:Structural maintenance of chromosomes protein n=1 Tax=Denticeps clupeoides TaxID=299321 RepID=A0AAY4E330_9TELE
MPPKTSKASTAAKKRGKGSQPRDDSDEDFDAPPKPARAPAAALDGRSLEEILASIPPPPPPAMTNEPGAPRLMITHIVNRNFKSYAGEQILGPFHKRFSCIIGPNGSGKSNVIDSMLFVFGYRAQKIRSKKLSVLIHSSDKHKDVQSCTVEVHFQKIIDKEGDDFEVIPDSNFSVSRTANKDNSSVYHIDGKKATFKDVGTLLRSHGIDLDHNRFLILQGEVEQIAMMKPKGQTEHDEGMLEYLEDIIGSCRLKEPIQTLCHCVEHLNEQRGEKLNRVKMVEKEKRALEGEKNVAVEFLTLENQIFKKRSQLCQFYVKLGKLTKYIEGQKEKFTQMDLQDVEVREKLKHCKSKAKKLEKQLQKDREKLEEVRNIPASSEKTILEATSKKEDLEKQKVKEEEKLSQVMESLKEETRGLQQDKESKEKELMELSKSVNETRSRMDVAQSELDLYLSQHNTALTQLNQGTDALQSTTDTLKERRAAIKELEVKIPKCGQELKKVILKWLFQMRAKFEVLRDLRQKVEEAKSSLSSNRSRGKVLDALMQQKRSGNIPGILGRLVRNSHFLCCFTLYDIAISSSCGSLDNILVDTIDTAQKCVTFLKTQNIGVATFIGLDKMKVWENAMGSISTPENIPRLFDMVKVKDEAVRPAFYFALRDTLVAADLEQATRVAFQKNKRWRVVTLQGQIIEQSGTMTGGGGRVMKGRMGSSIGTEITQEEKLVQRQGWQERRQQLEENVHRLRHELRDMKNTLEKYTASIQSLADQEIYLKGQVKQLEANVIAAAPDKTKQKQMEKNFEVASSKAGKVESEVKRLHTLIVDINSHKLKAQQDKLDKVNKEVDECSSAITKAQVAIKTAGRNLKKSEETVARLEAEMEDNKKTMEEIKEQLTQLEEEAAEIMKTCQEAEGALPEMQDQHRELEQQIKELQEQEHMLQKESLNVRLKVEQIDTVITENQSKIKHWQKEGTKLSLHSIDDKPEEELPTLTPEELEAVKSGDVIKNEIALLEDRCANMKPNLGAIAEFKKKEELYLQRVAELDEITTQRDNFKRGYEDLRKQRLNEFMAGFNIITNKLKENYQMLTQGGDAELELVDSLDPFSEGIMFSVRPPKKSWKKIFNLSGGEKTLSSLALVFALHHFKPTPLYFMDEIDAALDFKNVSIVACYIYEQTKNAQFIIISLRNNMFEIADRLIGIYKTHNTTKSVPINPKTISLKEVVVSSG